jgi:hypothetical protein
MIREMKVPDVQDLEDLFKKALRELGVPVSMTLDCNQTSRYGGHGSQ